MNKITLPDPVLVGRKKELEELKQFLNLAVKGKGTTVFISGKAGIGKTRLVNEFLNIIKKKDIMILSGWCLSNAALPYFPFIEAFSSDLSRREGGVIIQQQLRMRSWMPESYEPERFAKKPIVAPQVWKDQVFASVTRELLYLSSIKPLILVLEDMHWADSASLALLHYISRTLVNEKILVLVIFRNEELGRDSEGHPHPLTETTQLMGREDLFKEIKLTNLDKDDVRRIAESMLGGNVAVKFIEKLVDESRCNPLFVVEFLRMLSEKGSLILKKNQWQLAVEKLGIPLKVRDIIQRRIDALRPNQRRVLDVASVIGDRFNPDLIGGVLSKDRLEILEQLNDILQFTSLVSIEKNFYTFDHAKSREVLYDRLSLPLKQGYHERIAQQIEIANQKGKEISQSDLAYHYAKAGNEDKALKYSLAGGQDALAKFSNAEAIKHFKYVLELVANRNELTDERKVALEGLGDAYAAHCMYTEAIKTFDQLAESGTGSLRLRALRKAMDAAFIKGDKPDLLLEYAKKAEKLALDDRLEMARVIMKRGRAFGWAGRGERKLDLADYEAALRIFEEENSIGDLAEALFRVGEVYTSTSDLFQKGLSDLLRSRAIFSELGDIRKEIAVSRAIGSAFLYLRFFLEAKQEFCNVLRIGEKIGIFNELARAIGILGLIDEYEGKLEEALSKVLKALEYVKKTDVNYVKAFDLGALTRLYSKLGDVKRADEYLDKLIKLPPEVLSTWIVSFNAALSRGVYLAAKGQFKESNQIFEDLGASFETSLHITDYIWALEKQGKIEEVKEKREMVKKFLEQNEKLLKHTKIQLNVLVPRVVQVGEVVKVRLDLVNVAKNPGIIIKIEGIIPFGSKVISLPSFCSIQNSSIKMNNKTIDPFEVEPIKIKISFAKAGVYDLYPCLYYIDDLGESRTSKTKPITVSVQLGSGEGKPKSVAGIGDKLEFKSEAAEKAFNYLVSSFRNDYVDRRLPLEKSGWRTLTEVAKNAKVTMYSMYGRDGRGGKVISELANLGLIESRFFLGERGRGGRVLKMRIYPEKKTVRRRLNQ